MNIDKSLSQAPMGLGGLGTLPNGMPEDEEEIEIVIEDDGPEAEGFVSKADEEEVPGFNDNLAETLDDKKLAMLGSDLIELFEADVSDRSEWMRTYVDGLELLGLKIENRTEPWEGACGVYHPLLSEALVKFQAETMMDTFPASGPVKTQIIGKETQAKTDAATRVREDMNYQLTERMTEYRPEHERMLWGLGLAGNAFKKVYFDPALNRQVSLYVPAEDIVVPYGASSLDTAPRFTHVMRKTENDIKKLQVAKFYRDIDLGSPQDTLDDIEKMIAEKMGFKANSDNRFKVLEFHVDLDLNEYDFEDEFGEDAAKDGIALPYVVTVEKTTGEVLAIRRNWLHDDDERLKRMHFVHYAYIPGFGFYAFGLIHLIGAFAKSGTALIRQLVDAGTLSNLPGGFKTNAMRVRGDDTPIGPGEWRDVDVASGVLRDNIMPLPYKEPSMVLATLLDKIIEEGRRFASAADLQVSDMSAQAPVGTTLAILERTLKIMSAVQARVHYAMKQEFKLLKGIIRDYTPQFYTYEPEEGTAQVKQTDYDMVEVIPVSDPNQATMAQKVVQYQAVLQLAQSAPQLYDMATLHRQMLEVLGIKNAAKLVPIADDQKPLDPVSENMNALKGKPLVAFIGQDHEAHLQVHMNAIQDPKIQQIIGQNPQAQAIMAALQAHIAEHVGFQYRLEIERLAGVPYPEPDAKMDPATEVQISRLAAAASQKLLGKNQTEAAAQQAQQAANDPIVQIQQKELEIKAREIEIKDLKLKVDAADKADKNRIQEERIASAERIAGLNAGVKLSTSERSLTAQQQAEGMRLGVDAAKTVAQQAHDRQQAEDDRKHKEMLTDKQNTNKGTEKE